MISVNTDLFLEIIKFVLVFLILIICTRRSNYFSIKRELSLKQYIKQLCFTIMIFFIATGIYLIQLYYGDGSTVIAQALRFLLFVVRLLFELCILSTWMQCVYQYSHKVIFAGVFITPWLVAELTSLLPFKYTFLIMTIITVVILLMNTKKRKRMLEERKSYKIR